MRRERRDISAALLCRRVPDRRRTECRRRKQLAGCVVPRTDPAIVILRNHALIQKTGGRLTRRVVYLVSVLTALEHLGDLILGQHDIAARRCDRTVQHRDHLLDGYCFLGIKAGFAVLSLLRCKSEQPRQTDIIAADVRIRACIQPLSRLLRERLIVRTLDRGIDSDRCLTELFARDGLHAALLVHAAGQEFRLIRRRHRISETAVHIGQRHRAGRTAEEETDSQHRCNCQNSFLHASAPFYTKINAFFWLTLILYHLSKKIKRLFVCRSCVLAFRPNRKARTEGSARAFFRNKNLTVSRGHTACWCSSRVRQEVPPCRPSVRRSVRADCPR